MIRRLSFNLLMIFLMSFQSAAHSRTYQEEEIMAAYLINFILYTEWPEGTFSSAAAPLRICVEGDKKMEEMIGRMASVQKKVTRPLEVHSIGPTSRPDNCHVLFIGDALFKNQEVRKSLEQKAVLTVGQGEEFSEAGGMISYVPFEETVQFYINLNAAEKGGLKLSSRMLALAKKIMNLTAEGKE